MQTSFHSREFVLGENKQLIISKQTSSSVNIRPASLNAKINHKECGYSDENAVNVT